MNGEKTQAEAPVQGAQAWMRVIDIEVSGEGAANDYLVDVLHACLSLGQHGSTQSATVKVGGVTGTVKVT